MKDKLFLLFFLMASLYVSAQLPPVVKTTNTPIRSTKLTQKYLSPIRVVWTSDKNGEQIKNTESILKPGNGQADLNQGKYLTLTSDGTSQPGIILDFGCEIQGGIEIVTTINNSNPAGRVRIRFGESVGETMSNIGENGATNDHAMRDFVVILTLVGTVGNWRNRFPFCPH